MRPQGTAQQLETRLRQAMRLLKAGKNLSAMAAGVTDRLFEVSDLVDLLEAEERKEERAA